MKLYLSLVLGGITTLLVQAQESPKTWTIDECVNYALSHNIQIQQSEIDQKSSLYSKQAAVANLFPSLNGSSSYFWNFGLNVDPVTNVPTRETRKTFNVSLSGNWVLIDGGQKWNALRERNLAYLSQLYSTENIQNDVKLNVASAFLQILLNREIYQVALEQQRVSQLQVDRIEKLVNAGSRPKGDQLQLEAQMARDQQNVIATKNALDISKLQLANLMQLENPDEFEIVAPEVELPGTENIMRTPESIYNVALESQPGIKSAEIGIQSSKEGVDAAHGAFFPTLSLAYGIGTNYSSQVEQFLGQDFPTQLDQNVNEYVGFNLNIPIFNRYQTKNNYQVAKLNLERAKLQYELSRTDLKQTIYQTHADAKASYNSYLAAQKSVASSNESFNYAKQRFEVGALNQFDFENAQNNLAVAKSEMIRAKYDYIFKIKVLEFYLTNQIKL